jgi:hypothetical protein
MNIYDSNHIDFTIGGKTILPSISENEQSSGWSDALNGQSKTITFTRKTNSGLDNIIEEKTHDLRFVFTAFRTTKGKQPRKVKVLKHFDFKNSKIKSDGQGGYFVTANIINGKVAE